MHPKRGELFDRFFPADVESMGRAMLTELLLTGPGIDRAPRREHVIPDPAPRDAARVRRGIHAPGNGAG